MVYDGSLDQPGEKVYDNVGNNNRGYHVRRSIFSSTDGIIYERNFNFMKKLPGDMQISYSRDSCVEDNNTTLYDAEFLIRVNMSGLPPHRLPLKRKHVLSSSRTSTLKTDVATGQGILF